MIEKPFLIIILVLYCFLIHEVRLDTRVFVTMTKMEKICVFEVKYKIVRIYPKVKFQEKETFTVNVMTNLILSLFFANAFLGEELKAFHS